MNEVILETKRLILKIPTQADFEELFTLRTDLRVMQYIGTGIQTKNQVQEFIENAKPYFDEYGHAFYSVFEKETGDFVGQAGLFHLGFNVNQPDIELAYRLHTKYWNKGYATELARALIKFGFKHFSLTRIVAIVYSENEASRRVMEKAGMSYQGITDFRGDKVARYEIQNPKLDLTKLQLTLATPNDYPTIKNMASYYVYDMSEYMKWPQEKNGTQSIGDHFEKYWNQKDTYLFIVRYQDELAGFVIINKNVTNPANEFSMAEIFILRQFKGRGLGEFISKQCFDKFTGSWEVFVMPGNEGAYRFWRRVIKKYTRNQFQEFTRIVNGRSKNIFEFNSDIGR